MSHAGKLGVVGSIILTLAVGLLLGTYLLRPRPDIRANFVGADTLAAPSLEGYARAYEPIVFDFPKDHGPHPEYQLEWWYYTGNLKSATGRHFGYQLTFFRRALAPALDERDSRWGANQAYLAHFALTDVATGTFHNASELARGGEIGVAGARALPFRVFVKSWSAEGTGASVRLRAATEAAAIDLQLESLKLPTLQGQNGDGLSQKGAEPGNASYYYSLTRMATTGTITVKGETIPVEGFSWMDHEFGTSALGEGQVGWDWFGLQFDDNRELMWGQLRRADGSIDVGQGSITLADGQVLTLAQDDVQVETLATWRSPRTGAEYPARWRMTIPRADLELVIEPLINNQELNVGLTYWEGAVRISGTTTGYGYVELTGYGLDAPPVR